MHVIRYQTGCQRIEPVILHCKIREAEATSALKVTHKIDTRKFSGTEGRRITLPPHLPSSAICTGKMDLTPHCDYITIECSRVLDRLGLVLYVTVLI